MPLTAGSGIPHKVETTPADFAYDMYPPGVKRLFFTQSIHRVIAVITGTFASAILYILDGFLYSAFQLRLKNVSDYDAYYQPKKPHYSSSCTISILTPSSL